MNDHNNTVADGEFGDENGLVDLSDDDNETGEISEATDAEEISEETPEETKPKGIAALKWVRLALRDKHGSVDKLATLAYIEKQLDDVMKNEVGIDDIANAVKRVFAPLLEKSPHNAQLDITTLTTRACNYLSTPDGSDAENINRVKKFARGETERFEATGGAEGIIYVKKGAGGGVRWSTPAFVKEWRALQAKKAAAAKK